MCINNEFSGQASDLVVIIPLVRALLCMEYDLIMH